MTDLLDPIRYPEADFAAWYHARWDVETYLGHLKPGWEVERFSSGQSSAVKPDF